MPTPTIEIYMKNVPKFGAFGLAHSFLVYTNEDGDQYYLRGGPAGDHSLDAPYGQLTIIGADSLHPYLPGTVDYGNYEGATIYTGDDAKEKFLAAQLLGQDLSGQHNYDPFIQNCNTATFLFLEVMDLTHAAYTVPNIQGCGLFETSKCLAPGFGYNDASFQHGSVDSGFYLEQAADILANNPDSAPQVGASDTILSEDVELTEEMAQFLEGYDVDPSNFDSSLKGLLATTIKKLSEHQVKAAHLFHQQQLQAGQQMQLVFQGMHDFAGVFGALGDTFGIPVLKDVQVGAQSVIAIVKNGMLLAGAIPGFAAPVGLAALTPVSAIVMGGLTLFKLFRSRRNAGSPLQAIAGQLMQLSEQIRQLHFMMQENFTQVFANQRQILDAIVFGVEHLAKLIDRRIDDVIAPVMYTLSGIDNRLIATYSILFQQSLAISLHDLEEAVQFSERIIEENPSFNQDLFLRFFEMANKFELWLIRRACEPIYTGRIGLEAGVDALEMMPAQIGEDSQYYFGLLGYLAARVQVLLGDDEFPEEIDTSMIMNPEIWMSTLNAYLNVRDYLSSKQGPIDVDQTALRSILMVAQNTHRFLTFLQQSTLLYEGLFERYRNCIEEVRSVVGDVVAQSALEDVMEHLQDQNQQALFAIDVEKFAIISPAKQAEIAPVYDQYKVLLDTQRQVAAEFITDRLHWVGKLINDRASFEAAVTALTDETVPETLVSAAIAERFDAPLNCFAVIGKATITGYTIPFFVRPLLAQIDIPPLYYLAESMGVLHFDLTYEWHSNPSARTAGMRMANDEYRYSVTVVAVTQTAREVICTFDCTGSLLDHDDTRPIADLHASIHSYWYFHYNIHYGDGRYAADSVGYAMSPIMYAVAVIAPFMGTPPVLLADTVVLNDSAEFRAGIQEAMLQRIDAVNNEASLRLRGLPNQDWVQLQPVVERARNVASFLRVCMQAAGFSRELIDQLPLLNEGELDNQIVMQLLPVEVQQQLILLDNAGGIELQRDLLVILDELNISVGHVLAGTGDAFTSDIEENLQFWINILTSLLLMPDNLLLTNDDYDCESEDEFDPVLDEDFPDILIPRGRWLRETAEGELDQPILLGIGSFGTTYSGRFKSPAGVEQPVAIKSIDAGAIDAAGLAVRESFLNEVSHLKQFKDVADSRIVRLFGITKHRKLATDHCRYSLLMEKADMSLESLLSDIFEGRRAPLEDEEKNSLVCDIATGIMALHAADIIHRDIKPSNILIFETENGLVAKISDVGISEVRETLTTHGTMLPGARAGTLFWQAPEVLFGKRHSKSSDMFSFALVAWSICADAVPLFDSDNPDVLPSNANLLRTLYENGIRPIIPGYVPAQLGEVIVGCWKDIYLKTIEGREVVFVSTGESRLTAEEVVAHVNGAHPGMIVIK